MQTNAESEEGIKAAVAVWREVVPDLKGQVTKDLAKAQDSGFVRESGQSKELRDFMRGLHNENGSLHALCKGETHGVRRGFE